MPANAEQAKNTALTVDHAANTIRLVRDMPAPPAAVFDAWTHADQVMVWWDPAGKRLSACQIDLCLGGAFRFVTVDHPDMPFAGVYRHIDRPSSLEFEAMGALGRVVFQPLAGGTRMTVEIECASPEHLEQYLTMGVDKGTAQTLDNLVAYIGRARAPA